MGLFGGLPQMPLYIHHAQLDEVTPVQDVRNPRGVVLWVFLWYDWYFTVG